MQEMQVDVEQHRLILREGVDPGILHPPVEMGLPVFDQLPLVFQVGSQDHAGPGAWSGKRVRARRSRKSVMAGSGICSVAAVTGLGIFRLPRRMN
jgi:hypothetical protein